MKNQNPLKKFSVLIIISILTLLLSINCGQKPGIDENTDISGNDNTEFDELFNTTTGQDVKKANEDEDEVLRLLGLTKQEKTVKTQESIEEQKPPEKDNAEQITALEKEIDSKDLEIQKLTTELDDARKRTNELIGQLENEKSKSIATLSPPSNSYRARYENARTEYEARNYRVAINLFEELLASDQSSSYADNCQYWIGESYYGLGNYTKAIAAFEKVFSFPNSNKNDDAQLKLGICYMAMNEKERAKEEFERLINHYPNSEYVTKARRFLNRL